MLAGLMLHGRACLYLTRANAGLCIPLCGPCIAEGTPFSWLELKCLLHAGGHC